jgi:hypothetical protein
MPGFQSTLHRLSQLGHAGTKPSSGHSQPRLRGPQRPQGKAARCAYCRANRNTVGAPAISVIQEGDGPPDTTSTYCFPACANVTTPPRFFHLCRTGTAPSHHAHPKPESRLSIRRCGRRFLSSPSPSTHPYRNGCYVSCRTHRRRCHRTPADYKIPARRSWSSVFAGRNASPSRAAISSTDSSSNKLPCRAPTSNT